MNTKASMDQLEQQSFRVNFNFEGTCYRALETIGMGAYGVVCSALNVSTGTKAAIKKIANALHNPTITKRTLREVRILRHFQHENIISIRDMISREGMIGTDIYIVFDLMETDLHQVIHSKQPLSLKHVQYFLYQILRGLKYIHSANIIHRDLKPSNLMVNSDCLLKIGDFGMARVVTTPQMAAAQAGRNSTGLQNQLMTQYVATRWYRAPELLFSMLDYGTAVDLWSAGCIVAEMINRRQLFPGKDQLSQLKLIINYLGTPPKELMDAIPSEMIQRIIHGMGPKFPLSWATIMPRSSKEAQDLVSRIMCQTPWERLTAIQALQHPFLADFHDPNVETVCRSQFQWSVNNVERMSKQEVCHALLLEVEVAGRRQAADNLHNMRKPSQPLELRPQTAEEQKKAMRRNTRSASAHDIEMLSAQLDNSSLSGRRLSMFAARAASPMRAEKDPATSTRAKLKKALLHALESKKKTSNDTASGNSSQSKAVTTAQTRHLEKVKRKKKHFEKREDTRTTTDGVENGLTESDQNLLNRWSMMQMKRVASQPDDESATASTSVGEVAGNFDQTDCANLSQLGCTNLDQPEDVCASTVAEAVPVPAAPYAASEAQKMDAPHWLESSSLPNADHLLYRDVSLAPQAENMMLGTPDSSDNRPRLSSQLGDIISKTFPTPDSSVLSGRDKSLDSAQLMEDWLAATELNPEELKALEREIAMSSP